MGPMEAVKGNEYGPTWVLMSPNSKWDRICPMMPYGPQIFLIGPVYFRRKGGARGWLGAHSGINRTKTGRIDCLHIDLCVPPAQVVPHASDLYPWLGKAPSHPEGLPKHGPEGSTNYPKYSLATTTAATTAATIILKSDGV